VIFIMEAVPSGAAGQRSAEVEAEVEARINSEPQQVK